MTFGAVLILIVAVACWGVRRIICYQDYQVIRPMMIGEFRCCWRESGFTYAGVAVQEWRRWRWVTVWQPVQGLSYSYMTKILPDELRAMYERQVCEYIRYRDAWAKETRVINGNALTRS